MVKIQVLDGFDLDSLPHFPPKWSRFGSNLFKMPASIFEADGYPLVQMSYVNGLMNGGGRVGVPTRAPKGN